MKLDFFVERLKDHSYLDYILSPNFSEKSQHNHVKVLRE